jgi:hypothetical protein
MKVNPPSVYIDHVVTVEARHRPADPDNPHDLGHVVHVDLRDGPWGYIGVNLFGPPELLELLGRAIVEAVTAVPETPGSPVIITPKLEDLEPRPAVED